MSSYNASIPQPNDLLSDSQGQILQNFGALNTVYGTNHFPFDNNMISQIGKHKFVQMPVTTTPVTLANEGTLYSKAVTGGTALFFTRDVTSDVQLTSPVFTAPVAATNGYTFIPGGLILQWGTVTPITSTGTVLFSAANIAFPNNCFNVQCTLSPATPPTGNAQTLSIYSISSNSFIYNYSGGSAYNRFYWWAIGN